MSVSDYLQFGKKDAAPSAQLPADFVVLITDQLEASGTFLLTHFVHRALRPHVTTSSIGSSSFRTVAPYAQGRQVVFVGVVNPIEHYQSILRRNGVQLVTERQKGSFTWIDAAECVDARELYEALAGSTSHVGASSVGPLVVIEDLSALLWSGYELGDVHKLVMSLRRLVHETNATLVMLMHADSLESVASKERQLFTKLFGQSDLWLEVTNLETQSRGELSVHLGPCLQGWDITPRSGPTALQYKMEESGAMVHVKGLGRGFL